MAAKDYNADIQSSKEGVTFSLIGTTSDKPNFVYVNTIIMHGPDGKDRTFKTDKPMRVEVAGNDKSPTEKSVAAIDRLIRIKTSPEMSIMTMRFKEGAPNSEDVKLIEVIDHSDSAKIKIDPKDAAMLASLGNGPDVLSVPNTVKSSKKRVA